MSAYKIGGHVYMMEENKAERTVRRRRHSAAFKAEAVAACKQPGVSTAAVAMRYQINANLLRRWVVEQEACGAPGPSQAVAVPAPEFVPLHPGTVSKAETPQDIIIEVRRGPTTVTVRWPGTAAADCAAWMQGWLR